MYPNCVDERIYDPGRFTKSDRQVLRSALGIAEDAVVATFIGTFGRWHGVDVLARAIAHLARQDEDWVRRNRLRFLLVGDGMRMQEVRGILTDSGADRYVTLTGLIPQERGAGVLAASDILLSPHVPNPDGSPFFGSPTKLFEYMAMGKGIVASALDQIADVLAPGVAVDALPTNAPGTDERRLAVLAPPGDEHALIQGVRFLVEQPAWREVLGNNARRKALSRYTWRHHVDAILGRARELGLSGASRT
jgi:glycosyltransferase involved in cell wall biosynthesis